jgi:NADH-quinone oxidoreductase subunit G
LQDQALGYGAGDSRFTEEKRAVNNLDIGPLIETEMTRCIHCTRCVRFGQEIAGVMEFGAVGRGEDMKITTFMEESVDSEVSGNVIDLCPVGALTSKPYRFSARSWEMTSHRAISPHDSLGSNLIVQSVGGEVKRVLPESNMSVNECWLSDRDRFSYEAVNSTDRLLHPLIRRDGRMEECSWETALSVAADNLQEVVNRDGGDALGALCTPTATLEEFYLFQKLLRGLGSQNIDHRLRQQDFRDDLEGPICPGSQLPISEISSLSSALLIGCNIRKELPLVALRFRKLSQNGGRIATLNPLDFKNNFVSTTDWITEPHQMPAALAAVASALAKKSNVDVPDEFEIYRRSGFNLNFELASEIASLLSDGAGKKLLVLGQLAVQHFAAAELRTIAYWMSLHCDVQVAVLPEANSAAGWLAGCIPHRGVNSQAIERPGRNAATIAEDALSACVLFGLEPFLDYASPVSLDRVLSGVEFVLSFSAFRSGVPPAANIVLPMTPFTENSGTFVNLEGKQQFSTPAATPKGQSRPGWKILRVLGNLLGLKGFEYVDVHEVTREVSIPDADTLYQLNTSIVTPTRSMEVNTDKNLRETFQRVLDVPIYSTDPIVRRANSLQATRDSFESAAYFHPHRLVELGLEFGTMVTVRSEEGAVKLPVQPDNRLLATCSYIPAGRVETALLGNSRTIWLEFPT